MGTWITIRIGMLLEAVMVTIMPVTTTAPSATRTA